MSKEVECLDAMIFEGEARIAELEDELLAGSGDMDIERTMHIFQLMYRNLNRLYAERISLSSGDHQTYSWRGNNISMSVH